MGEVEVERVGREGRKKGNLYFDCLRPRRNVGLLRDRTYGLKQYYNTEIASLLLISICNREIFRRSVDILRHNCHFLISVRVRRDGNISTSGPKSIVTIVLATSICR